MKRYSKKFVPRGRAKMRRRKPRATFNKKVKNVLMRQVETKCSSLISTDQKQYFFDAGATPATDANDTMVIYNNLYDVAQGEASYMRAGAEILPRRIVAKICVKPNQAMNDNSLMRCVLMETKGELATANFDATSAYLFTNPGNKGDVTYASTVNNHAAMTLPINTKSYKVLYDKVLNVGPQGTYEQNKTFYINKKLTGRIKFDDDTEGGLNQNRRLVLLVFGMILSDVGEAPSTKDYRSWTDARFFYKDP
ncbi:MAG: putative capsid protein [Proteusivirus raitis]|uniref:Putative capsid protein n=1 Tax=Circoviridae sp. TaxID=1954248 RepID=A0A345MZ66_9VIRU|nr:MAG: putative capsid protein [Circoviridae sp.]